MAFLASLKRRLATSNRLVLILVSIALGLGIATWLLLSREEPSTVSPDRMTWLIGVDIVVLGLLSLVIGQRLLSLWLLERRGRTGSGLHLRLALLFGILAAVPTVAMATFAAAFFHFGVQAWFSDRVDTAIKRSVEVAEAYLAEHQQLIRADALAMANDLNREAGRLTSDPAEFAELIDNQTLLRDLSEAWVIDASGRILARSKLAFSAEFTSIADEDLETSRGGEVVLLETDTDDRVRALVSLDRFVDAYLVVGRLVDPKVLEHLEAVRHANREYDTLIGRQSQLQAYLTVTFTVIALLLLLAAIGFGIQIANRLAAPITAVIGAAERVRAGDLTPRLDEETRGDELGLLARSFNRMTSQLAGQRGELLEATRQIDRRRRLTEAILHGVSAGVLGVSAEGKITLANGPASELLGQDVEALVGADLSPTVPEIADMVANAARLGGRVVNEQIELSRPGLPNRSLLVRAVSDSTAEPRGTVVTFDDVTELVNAQRKAAWSDVARRIAHEIKNPLTPIQLAAERLRRRFLKSLPEGEEAATVSTLIDTIIRQVATIGRMVDEFSTFARMPAPQFKPEDLALLARQALALQEHARPDIHFTNDGLVRPLAFVCDARQITQVFTNLLQNAIDALDGRAAEDGLPAPAIGLSLGGDQGAVTISVEDNGPGLPVEMRERLTEPYVTTKAKGSGLGLAIVKRIVEEHGGTMRLEDRPGGGARIVLSFDEAKATT